MASLADGSAGGGSTETSVLAAGEPISEAEALRRLRQTDDQSLQYYAAWWLGRMRSRHPEAVPLLRAALSQRQPRDPAAGVEHNAVARNAARALGKLGDASAIPDLLATLEDEDDGLREASARALGELRAENAVVPLCARLASGPSGAGAPLPNSPRLREPCEALIEALGDIGIGSDAVLSVIEPFTDHDRPLIRSAAARALLQLSGDPRWGQLLLELLRHPQLQVRRAALMDLGAVGWRPALEPIRGTLAENSLKLIALRGLAERQPVSRQPANQPDGLHSDGLPSGRLQPDGLQSGSLPSDSQPFENRPFESFPFENRSFENKPFENQPFANKPVENKPVENKPVENHPPGSDLSNTDLAEPHPDRDPANSPLASQLPNPHSVQHPDLLVDGALEAVLDVMDALL
jgi:phycocyanobilin lyase alpha subunit